MYRTSRVINALFLAISVVAPRYGHAAEPCAVAAQLIKQNPSYISPQAAIACLKSVPVDTQGDIEQLEGLYSMMDLQSTTAYLKDPPPGWLYPGVDLKNSLLEIMSDVKKGKYESEYDVQADIYALILSAHDFHLVYWPDIVYAFSWNRGENLISVSKDGTTLPEVYLYSDLPAILGEDTSYKPSPVSQISGVDVDEYLAEYAALNPWDHDPDANYNYAVWNTVTNVIASEMLPSTFQQTYTYQGTETIVKVSNGTSIKIGVWAVPATTDWSGVTNGKTFFEKFCSGSSGGSSSSSAAVQSQTSQPASASSASSVYVSISSVAATSAASSAAGSSSALPSISTENSYLPASTSAPVSSAPSTYPRPLVIARDQSIAGYFPEGYSDLAVLSVPTFGPSDTVEFQDVLRTFLASAKKAGKSKLIIDVRGNGGGTVGEGYDMFKQLFPSLTPQDISNLAASPLLNAMGETASGLVNEGKLTAEQLGTLSAFDYQTEIDPTTNKSFTSWSDFYGPVKHYGAEFTNIRGYNLSQFYNGINVPVYGYINDTRPQPQTFSSDNIVILSDGFCGSTCALFSEFMKTQGKVQSITVGGRPQYGPSQPVGGSKGANDQKLSDIDSLLAAGIKLDPSEFKPWVQAGLPAQWSQVLARSVGETANLNFLNNLRKGDSSATPLMFVYEASSCRFFYTAEMLVNQTAVWQQAYDLQWNGGQCVKDSTGQPSAEVGYSTSYINSKPPAGADNSFGAPEKFSYPGAYSQGQQAPSATIKPSFSVSASSAPHAASATKKANGADRMAVGSSLLLALGAAALVA